MLTVNVNTGASLKVLFTSETPFTVFQVWDHIQLSTAISKENFYIIYNGRLANDMDTLSTGSAIITPRLFGGKGGFGSMLRAIGAQIEKTTNREACRDLSGRRLRDINEEKRLKLWIEKQSNRQDEASERKKRKLEKLCSEPKHEFKDQKYDEERSILTERVFDAVEEGFKAAAATSSGLKRTSETQPKKVKKKKVTLGFGLDLDSDELDSSDEDSNESQTEKSLVSEENNTVNIESKTNLSEEASADNISDSNDATAEKSELVDNSVKRESKSNTGDEISVEEKIVSILVTTVEKSELAVSN